jgi:hypothetical protein
MQPDKPLQSPAPKPGQVISGNTGGSASYTCEQSSKTAGALHSTLVSLDRGHYAVGDKQTFEVRLENTGSGPLQIPISPYLSDLQPGLADGATSSKFSFSRLRVQIWLAGQDSTQQKTWSSSVGAGTNLYGSSDHPGTIVTLQPGEWVRIVGSGVIAPPGSEALPVDHANVKASIDNSQLLVTAGASAEVTHEVCVDQTQGADVAMTLDVPR